MKPVIRQGRAGDVAQVSRIHMDSFKGYFLSAFGEIFLQIYYSQYLTGKDNIFLIAEAREGTIAGFAAGTCNEERFYQNLFGEHFFRIARIALGRLMSSDFRKQLVGRKKFIANALKSKVFPRKRKKASEKTETVNSTCEGKRFTLLSIAVLNEVRGTGIASLLMKAFEDEALKLGGKECLLSVKPGNGRGISFYKKAAWQIIKKTDRHITFYKSLN